VVAAEKLQSNLGEKKMERGNNISPRSKLNRTPTVFYL
jgi:hypothetical protein